MGWMGLWGFVASALAMAGGVGIATSARAQSYLQRPISLRSGELRVDIGPSDYGYMDHGAVNDSRGFRIHDRETDAAIALGTGVAYGFSNRLEGGALVLPLQLSPSGDMGDLELYGRFALTRSLALQGTLQLPTQTDLGLGVGVPIKVVLGAHRLETGVELEFIFKRKAVAHIDIPFALSFAVADNVFFGPRSGVFFDDLADIAINMGIQGGVTVADAVDLTASFNAPRFLWTGPGDAVGLDGWQLIMGVNLYLSI